MEVAIRKMGNSQGVLIPKPILAQVGLQDSADLQVRDGVIEIRPICRNPREGWANDAQRLAEHGDDALVWPEFANEDDDELVWVMLMKTGEIWLAQLDPTVGSEIQKTRPCVVISPDEMNAHLRTVIVAPMTTGSRPAQFRIALTFQGKQGLIVLDQIRTLDRTRLVKRLGALRSPTLATTLQTLQDMFAR